jgi:hypothetical protein
MAKRQRGCGGNSTLEDIWYTLNVGIPATLRMRLRAVCNSDSALNKQILNKQITTVTDSRGRWEADLIQELVSKCNVQVHITDRHPMTFLIAGQDSVFSEQYHLGKPPKLRAGMCIGKNVPVIEYANDAPAAGFLRAYFLWMWEKSDDVTVTLIDRAMHQGFYAGTKFEDTEHAYPVETRAHYG